MHDFTGKICPYCKTAFEPGDDVVVCSDCDMPHHKDCWIENQGCTTFGCLGTIKNADRGASSVMATQMIYEDQAAEHVFCTRCGSKNSAASSFCVNCGNRLTRPADRTPPQPAYQQPTYQQPTYQQPTYQQQSYQQTYTPYQTADDPVEAELVGQRTDYYLPKFREMKAQDQKASWNWAAFWLSGYWLFYRKMYAYGAAVLGSALLFGLLDLGMLTLAGDVLLGIFANFIYRKRIEKLASEARTMTEPYRSSFIEKNGGVNVAAAILTAVGQVLLVILLFM